MELQSIHAGTPHPVECGASFAQTCLVDRFADRLVRARVAVITDREVAGYYAEDFSSQFRRAGIDVVFIQVDAREAAKSFDTVRPAYERLTDMEFSSADLLFALGGGGVMDAASFVAATYHGGVDCVLVPTSLLAMIDSSVSQQAYLNFMSHKNQIGVSFTPYCSVIDTDYLRTLPVRYQANGYAQLILYGLLSDPSLLTKLEQKDADKLALIDAGIRARGILFEKNTQYLSLGHEISNAIEGHFRFLKYTHGEALALGILAHYSSESVLALYKKYGLPTEVSGVTRETLLKRILREASGGGDKFTYVSLPEPGRPVIQSVPVSEVEALFDRLLTPILT